METPDQQLNNATSLPIQSKLGFAIETDLTDPRKSSLWVELLQNSKRDSNELETSTAHSVRKSNETLMEKESTFYRILKDQLGMLFLRIFLKESGNFYSYSPKIEFLHHVTIFRSMQHSQSSVVFASKIFNKFFINSNIKETQDENTIDNKENQETYGIETNIANCQIAIDGIDEKHIEALKVKL